MKTAAPKVEVVGGALSHSGTDRRGTGRDTHSPAQFILDMGAAYRASHRTKPIMDAFAYHPYLERSDLPPTFRHPLSKTLTIADYGKLVSVLGRAFDGTAQKGSKLPLVYDEFGVESRDPRGQGRSVHRHGARDDAPGHRGDPGRLLRAGDAPRRVPADGADVHDLPPDRQPVPLELAVGGLLRRPADAEVEPRGGRGGGAEGSGRRRRQAARSSSSRSRSSTGSGARSSATSTAPTRRDTSGSREAGSSRPPVAARSPASPRRISRPAALTGSYRILLRVTALPYRADAFTATSPALRLLATTSGSGAAIVTETSRYA